VQAVWVMKQMEYAGNRLNIVILDACRNNPLSRSMRSSDRGLARMDAPKGSFIAYSTAPGDTAADGAGRNSPYTVALTKAMQEPGIAIEETFRNARIDVLNATAEKQVPWESSSLTGRFYFQPETKAAPAVSADTADATPDVAAAAKSLPAGVTAGAGIKDCPSCPDLIALPPGNFMMGATEDEDDATDAESPATKIAVGAFALGKFEVTRDEFAAFIEASNYRPASSCWGQTSSGKYDFIDDNDWQEPGFAQTDSDPVVCVTADDAQAYVKWLAKTTGKSYRLPSEAEWEYAARVGASGAYYWGSDAEGICANGNIADHAAARKFKGWNVIDCDDGHVFTAPVGSFAANKFGLFDMLGNVKEWTADCWNDDLEGIGPTAKARRSGKCDMRVVRGSAWDSQPTVSRLAYREGNNKPTAYFFYGFRVARDF
jgi:formylglycine-generating enzyme required for sulfatase activity